MSRYILSVCLYLCLTSGAVSAQQIESASGVEIGTRFGLSRLNVDGESGTLIGVPSAIGSIVTGNPSIYVSWFPDERFSIGTEFSLGRTSGERIASTVLHLAGRGAFHFGGEETSGAYLFGRGGLMVASGEESGESESETDVSLGGGLGYRWPLASGLVVRTEGEYRRWFDDPGINAFSFILGLGAGVGHASAVKNSRTTQAEIGTLFGLSRLSIAGEGLTLIGIPLAPVSGVTRNPYPSIYVSWFPVERFSIGTEFSLGRTSDAFGDESHFTSFHLAGRGAYHLVGVATSGAYAFGRGAIRTTSVGESGSATDGSLGGGLGYRWRVGSGLVVRAEGGYRRWFDDAGTNEFSLLLGLGASIGGN